MRASQAALWLAVATLAGCPPAAGPKRRDPRLLRPGGPADEVRSFSETESYVAIAEYGTTVFVGTSARLLRFERRTGRAKEMTRTPGRSIGGIRALAAHGATGLWVATDGGLLRWARQKWHVAPGAPRGVEAMLADARGLWVATHAGLWRLAGGAWKRLLPGANVKVLLQNQVGQGVWVGTAGEGVYSVGENGSLQSHSAANGQLVRHVRAITYTPEGGIFAVGTDKRKRPVLAFFDGVYWTAYRPSPAVQLHWVAQVNGRVLLRSDRQVLELKRHDASGGSPPASPLRLVGEVSPKAPASYPLAAHVAQPTGVWLPRGPTMIADGGDHVVMGTKTLGAVHFDGKRIKWYRTKTLVRHERRLKVACAKGGVPCYLAAGGRGHRFDGGRFSPLSLGPDATTHVQAFVNDRAGEVIAVHSPQGAKPTLVVSRLQRDGKFARQLAVEVAVPHGKALVHFARNGPQGNLWLGLAYYDSQRARRPWGVVMITPAGKLTYHRSTLLPAEDRPAGSLALPDDIRDVAFLGNQRWFSTGVGACRVTGSAVTLFTENDGLESEIVYAVGRSAKGEPLVATLSGLGRHDGKEWVFDFPAPLRTAAARALVLDRSTLWVGTGAGLVRLTGGTARRITAVDGLASDNVLDLYRTPGRALWVLTAGGLSIVEPGS